MEESHSGHCNGLESRDPKGFRGFESHLLRKINPPLFFKGILFCGLDRLEPEGWVGGDTWCPLCIGNYSKPRVLKIAKRLGSSETESTSSAT